MPQPAQPPIQRRNEMDRIVCVVGPTASGKTRLAVALAEALHGEVISCDSMQIYRRMDIGTAKPTLEEQRGIPHHMLDVAEPEEAYSVSKFVCQADPILQEILQAGKTAVLAGGTGLYMDALIRGNDFAPMPQSGVRQALEEQARQEGIASLLEKLRQVDPASAERLPAGDQKRIIRALEVYLETGETITAHNERTAQIPPKYNPVYLGLMFRERETLYGRIDRRVEDMVNAGLRREVQSLLSSGVPASATSMQAIGYKEPMAALRGEITWEQAVTDIKQNSRRYAKRQLTWFRRNQKTQWFQQTGQEDFSKILAWAFAQIPFFDRPLW